MIYEITDLKRIREVIKVFAIPIEIINDGLVMICDAIIMDDIGESLIGFGVNQKNLGDCYKDCAQGVFVGKQKNGLQNRSN